MNVTNSIYCPDSGPTQNNRSKLRNGYHRELEKEGDHMEQGEDSEEENVQNMEVMVWVAINGPGQMWMQVIC